MSPSKIQGSQAVVTSKPVEKAPPPPELVGTAKAVKTLGATNPGPGSISGRDLAAVISKAAKEPAGAVKEFETIKKFVETNGKQLSPEAKKVFEVFAKNVDLAKANRQDTIDFRSAAKMDREMAAAARPVDVNAKLPETKETPEVEGFGRANGKADLGDKLKYGNKSMSKDTRDEWSLKQSDLDPTVGDFTVDGKAVHGSPLSITHSWLDKELNTKFPGGVTFKPPFKEPAGSEAAIAKKALLNASNGAAEKGAENDLIVNLGVKGSPKPATMTTQTDKAGAVTVQVGTTVPTTKADFKTMDEARAAFKKFGMTIADAPPTAAGRRADPSLKDWTLGDLNKMHDGLSQMSPTEQKALDGVSLERRTIVPGHRDWVAEFSPETGHDPTTKEPIRKDKMIIADGTFAADEGGFVGDVKNPQFPSVRTVLHEAGHAVENKSQRDASIASEKAKFLYNEAVGPHAKVSKSWDTAYGKLKGADKDAAKQFNADYKDLDTKRAALAASKPDKVSENYDAVMKAQNKLTDSYGKLPDSSPVKKQALVLRDSSANMSLLYAKNVGDTGKTLSEKQQLQGSENISVQQQKFDKYVKDNGGNSSAGPIPEVTDYAVSGSRHENYAEAFSLFKTDPTWMKANSPLLYKYFANGEHLKD